MSGHPYTDKQVQSFMDAANRHIEELDLEDARLVLLGCHDAGITVTFPEPRFYVDHGAATTHHVFDREGGMVATFHGDDAERYAREHASRLNREVSS